MDFLLFTYSLTFIILSLTILFIWYKTSKRISYSVLLILIFLFIAGLFAAKWSSNIVDNDLRNKLKRQAESIARTINQERIKKLNFNEDDKFIPEFHRLKEQLTAYSKTLNIQGIYTLAKFGDSLVFGPESYPENHPSASEPGTVYEKPSENVINIFFNGKSFTEGPTEDEYGIFVSALAPVFDPVSGKVILVIGIDIDLNQWTDSLNKHRLIAFLSTLSFVLILLVGSILLSIKRKRSSKGNFLINYSETFIVAAFGLNLTLVAVLAFYDYESRNSEQLLTQIAEPQARNILIAFKNMRDFRLGGIVRVIQNQPDISKEDFHSLVAPALKLSGLESSLGWAVPVSESNRKSFEQKNAEHQKNFQIWEKDNAGNKIHAKNRNKHFPVLFIEPDWDSNGIIGFDLASDSAINSIINTSIANNLPIASEPFVLLKNLYPKNIILLLQPVFSADSVKSNFLGFAIAVIKIEPYLQKALFAEQSKETSSVLDLYSISSNGNAAFIASASGDNDNINLTFLDKIKSKKAVQYPMFIFGKTYSFIIYPDPNLMSVNTLFTGSLTAIIGLLITALFTAFTVFLNRRETYLEQQVKIKTAELSKSEETFRGFFNSSLVGATITYPDGKWLYFNDQFCNMLGYSRIEFQTLTWKDLTPKNNLEQELTNYNLVLKGKTPDNFEKQYIHKNGSLINVSISSGIVRNQNGSVAYITSIIQDITFRKQAENNLISKTALLESQTNSTIDGILIINQNRKRLLINHRMCEIFSVPENILSDIDDYALLNHVISLVKDKNAFIEKVEHLYSKPDEKSHDEIELKNGTILDRYSAPVLGKNGENFGRIWTFRDITERKIAEQSLRKSENELRTLNSEKDKFFSIIAHDLRSPFVSFLGLTEVMTQDISDMSKEEINKFANNLNFNANNLYRLLTNLLEWSAMKRGITKFNPAQISISEIIGSNLNLFKEQAKAKNITLTMRMTENISIIADKQMIDTVIRNLISNALKFTPQNGKVIITAKSLENKIEISVQDNGLGMNKNIIDNLFKLDVKTNRKGTNEEPSTGLGLLLCKEFIEKHNGTLNIQSQENKGSTFTITLNKQQK